MGDARTVPAQVLPVNRFATQCAETTAKVRCNGAKCKSNKSPNRSATHQAAVVSLLLPSRVLKLFTHCQPTHGLETRFGLSCRRPSASRSYRPRAVIQKFPPKQTVISLLGGKNQIC